MNNVKISYVYPPNGSNSPFDKESSKNYFIDARGYTFLGDYADFENPYGNERIHEAIPMGYKSIIVLKRYCMYINGDMVWQNHDMNSENMIKYDGIRGKFYICLNRDIEYSFKGVVSTPIRSTNSLPNSGYISIDGFLWPSYESAMEVAKEFTKKNDITCLICKVIDYVNWH